MAVPRLGPRSLRSAILAAFLLLGIYFTIRVKDFIHIFYAHAGTLVTQTEVADAYARGDFVGHEAVVPRIIHQIFHNWTHPSEEVLPLDWSESRQSCLDWNPDWENWLWTEKASLEFLQQHYPWFVHTYEGFTYPVQRIDTLRYFLIRHYGGIYIDLDNGCAANLEPLRYYAAWVTDGGQGALSNNILGAAPDHPFWHLMTDSLSWYAWKYPLPYITISYATGQWYETAIWEKYHSMLDRSAKGENLVRVLMDGREGTSPWIFFNHNRGGTWDNWDNQMFGWIGKNVALIAGIGAVVMVVLAGVIRCSLRWRASS